MKQALTTVERAINQSVNGRGERIRTSGPCLPKAVLYQAELHPDCIPTNFRSLGFPIVTLACVYFTFYCATSVPTLSLKGVTSNGVFTDINTLEVVDLPHPI